MADIYSKMNENELADVYFNKAKSVSDALTFRKEYFYRRHIPYLVSRNRMDEAKLEAKKLWDVVNKEQNLNFKLLAAGIKETCLINLIIPTTPIIIQK